MIKILTIIGARPQIIKAAALGRTIKNNFSGLINEVLVHTGQHYDQNMSEVFFEELEIPKADYNLGVGSASHGKQTARIIEGTENILVKEKPDYIILYGDTNSTLAGAVAASKMHIPIIHIEAGLRSFNRKMPEEINRVVCDHLSTLLFSPTNTGYQNLIDEGFNPDNHPKYTPDNPGIFHCGDVMYDNSLFYSKIAAQKSTILIETGVEENSYVLATLHRDNNTDDPERLTHIFESFIEIIKKENKDIILPMHPRTHNKLNEELHKSLRDKINQIKGFHIIEPVSFLDMIQLERHAKIIMTDSGGVQKEAYFFNKPCIVMRPETEWSELVEIGKTLLVDANKEYILSAYDLLKHENNMQFPEIFGNGKAAEFIAKTILENK